MKAWQPKSWLAVVCLSMALGAGVQAQTLRWSSQGDPQTMDPFSQNESLTNMINAQIYEFLVARDKDLSLVPGLATAWRQDGPLKWTFTLRPDVKFHDGRPFTADDVVFSLERAKAPTSQIAVYANGLGTAKRIDDLTVEFNLAQVNPIFLQHLNTLYIMSRGWAEQHKAAAPQNFAGKEESYSAFHTNGTGPYMLVSRQPDVRTVLKRNPNYWRPIEGNVQDVIYLPIKSPATRVAALISGEVDFVLDPPPTDLQRLKATPGLNVIEGMENRVVYIGMDQGRDELLYSSVKGRNPFKDLRVRQALYHAIDIETIRSRLMNGQAIPTGALVPSPLASFGDPQIEARLPYDLERARRLMAEAGYADGFDGHATTRPEQPTTYNGRARSCVRAVGHVGQAEPEGARERHAARGVLPQAGEARHEPLHVRLGRLDHRCRDHLHAHLSQPRREGRGRLQLRQLHRRQARRPGRRQQHRGRPGQAARTDQGSVPRAQRQGAPHPAAPPVHPVGGAQERVGGAPPRQLARDEVGDGQVNAQGLRSAKRTLSCACRRFSPNGFAPIA